MTGRVAVPTVTAAQMREVDRLMVNEYGIELIQMMENAGRSLAYVAALLLEQVRDRVIVVLAGKGNNGGGALAAARHLSNMGGQVHVVLAAGPDRLREPASQQASILERMRVPVLDGTAASSSRSRALIRDAAVVVDGMLGYSLRGAPRDEAAMLIEAANDCDAPVVALDVPSGVSVLEERVYDPAIWAATTVTLALPKTVLATDEARARAGDLYLADISVPPRLYERLGLSVPPLFASGSTVWLEWTADGWTFADDAQRPVSDPDPSTI